MHKLRLSDELAELIRGMHPLLKSKMRAALTMIVQNPASGKALKEELAGLRSFRVKRLRIVYRLSPDKLVEIVAVGPRKKIYEETYRLIKKPKRKK